jgi:hypothetical protein
LKITEMKESLVKAFLRHVFSVLPVFRYPLRDGEDPVLVAKNQSLESSRVSTFYCCNEQNIGVVLDIHSAIRFHDFDPPPPFRFQVAALLEKAIALPEDMHQPKNGERSRSAGVTKFARDLEAVVASPICRNPVTPSIGLDEFEPFQSARAISSLHVSGRTQKRIRCGVKMTNINFAGEKHA